MISMLAPAVLDPIAAKIEALKQELVAIQVGAVPPDPLTAIDDLQDLGLAGNVPAFYRPSMMLFGIALDDNGQAVKVDAQTGIPYSRLRRGFELALANLPDGDEKAGLLALLAETAQTVERPMQRLLDAIQTTAGAHGMAL